MFKTTITSTKLKLYRLHYAEILNVTFEVIFDPNDQYSSIVNDINLGSAPSSLIIPYNVIYERYPR